MIRLTIQRKVFLATFILATSMASLLLLFSRWNLEQGFERYVAEAEIGRLDWIVANAEREYAGAASWDFLRQNPREAWRRIQRRENAGAGRADFRPPPWEGGPPPWAGGVPPWDGQQAGPNPPPPQGQQGWQGPPSQPGQGRPPWPGQAGEGGPPPPSPNQPNRPAGAPGDVLSIGPRLALLDEAGKVLAGNAGIANAVAYRPINHDGQVVGRLALQAAPSSANKLEAAFLASQTRNLVLSGLAALGLSFLAAWWLARHFLAPIRDLTEGARRIAGHQLDTRIPVRRQDELGALAEDFNSMAEQLTRAEQSRRAWVSDTSHELRTPLAVLRAEVEALQDGVHTADAATLERLLRQIQQLTKLVDDLRLTLDRDPQQADLDRAPLAPVALLRELAAAFGKRYADAGLALDTAALADGGWIIRGDEERLVQVFSNLLENSLRYTHRGGRLRLAARQEGNRLRLLFDDTAPAPPPAALPRLFDRFYRAEPSRSRSLGGSGLGLAICKAIIEAHDGIISAAFSDLGGLRIRIELPLDNQP